MQPLSYLQAVRILIICPQISVAFYATIKNPNGGNGVRLLKGRRETKIES